MAFVDVIVTCKNNELIIANCLDSIFNQTFKEIQVYVCDDGSTDRTLDIIKKNYANATILNLSFGPARNRNEAIKISKSKYIVTMDSDAILTPNWIESMVKIMESDSKIGMAGGLLLQDDKTVFSKGGMISKRGFARDLGFRCLFSEEECNKIVYPAYICSATMIMRREMIEEIGAFEPTFYYSYEDADLGVRANLAGWKVVCFNKIRSYHLSQKTVSTVFNKAKREYLNNANRLFMVLTTFQLGTILKELPLHVGDFLNLVILGKEKRAFLSSYIATLKRFRYIYKVRRRNFKTRKISDRTFFETIHTSKN